MLREKLGAELDPPETPAPGTGSRRGEEEGRAKPQPAPGLHQGGRKAKHFAADRAVAGTQCLGQAGQVPQVPPRLLCPSPSRPCCQQRLGRLQPLPGLVLSFLKSFSAGF